MGKPNKKPFMILSVYQQHLSEVENVENTLDAFRLLKQNGITPKKVVGSYTYQNSTGVNKQFSEISMVIPESARVLAFKLVNMYNQECFLSVESDYSAYLVYPDTSETRLGQWGSVTEEQAEKLSAYTFDSSTGSFYGVK